MAEEGEDGQGNVLEERQKILELQSEQFRMQEQLQRLKNKKLALGDELQQRETEFLTLKNEFDAEYKKEEVKVQGQDKARSIAQTVAESDFIKQEVRKLLQKRVPVMATILEDADDAHAGLNEKDQKQDEAQKIVHNTVLINYVQLHDNGKRVKFYVVTYRIDNQTLPIQLLKDACSYWGCSHKDHALCVKSEHVDVQTLEERGENHKPLVEILNIKAESVLYLVSNSHIQKWKEVLLSDDKKKKQAQTLQQAEKAEPDDQNTSGGWFQTFTSFTKIFLSGTQNTDQKPEEFINAFRPWPGIYHLLKDRSRSREDSVKWQNVPFSDWVIFLVLILLSCLIIGYQNETNYYELKAGVQGCLIDGLPGENYRIAEPEPYFFDNFESPGPGLIWTEPTAGVSWDAGHLRLDGANESIRTRRAVPLNSRKIEVQANLPTDANCTEYHVTFGSQGDMLRFSWDCNRLAISAPGNVSSSVARSCSSGNPYSIMITLDVEGMMNLSDSSGCNSVALQHDLQTLIRPLYMFVGATGNGIFDSILATTRVAEPVRNFKHIRRSDDLWNWLGGPFIYQMFDPGSTLRSNYMPAGYVRIRQQKVKQKVCTREDIPSNLKKPCHYVEVNENTRDESEIPRVMQFNPSSFMTSGGSNPRVWQGPRLDIESPYGLIQHFYDTTGYAADYKLTPAMLGPIGAQQFSEDLEYFRHYWISTATRMMSIEFTLADHHIGGYVNVRLLLEISASGAIAPSVMLIPFHIFENSGDKVADGIDVLRWIIMLTLVMLFRVYREGKRKAELGKSGLHYIFSYNGFLDQAIIGLFFAIQYMRLQGHPLSPYALTEFYSYNRAADRRAQLRVAEAAFLCILFARWATLMRLFPVIYRFFKTFSNSLTHFLYFLAVFLPVFCGNLFAANAIWQPFVFMLSSWSQCLYVFFLSLQESFDAGELYTTSPAWCLAFLVWFFISIRIFLVHMFLAITVQCYFEVELIEGIRADDVKWDSMQWLDWMLWPTIFEKLTGLDSGISRIKGSQQGAAKDDDDDSDDDEDAEGKRE